MSKWAVFAILANLVAHGWSILVLLRTAKVVFGTALIDETDADVMFWLDVIAVFFTVLFVVFGRSKRVAPEQ